MACEAGGGLEIQAGGGRLQARTLIFFLDEKEMKAVFAPQSHRGS